MSTVLSYKDLIVWQKAMDLSVQLYELTKEFPENERFGLQYQMRRSCLSISSNIAEGKSRGTRKDYRHFVNMAFASGAELESQMEFCMRTFLKSSDKAHSTMTCLQSVMKMLNVLRQKLAEPVCLEPKTQNL